MNDFGRLLEKEIPRLRRYARALTRNFSRADDLVQETLVRAMAPHCGSNLRTWLFTIVHNPNADLARPGLREGMVIEFDDESPSPTAEIDRGLPLVQRNAMCRDGTDRLERRGRGVRWKLAPVQ